MKILIPTKTNSDLEELLKRELPGMEVVFASEDNEIIKQLEDTTILIPERYKIDKELLDSASNLKLIHCGTGYSNIDLNETKNRNILVATTPGIVAQSVAEHVFSFIHEFYKKTSELDQSMKKGFWSKDLLKPYFELSRKILGLVGFGNIGKRVYKIAEGYGMKTFVSRKKQNTDGFNIKLLDLNELYQSSDIVSLHIPLTQETKNMIGEKEFDLMKNTAYFINTSRGAIVDEAALVNALQKGKIAGAGIDVYVEEPLPENSPLRKAPNIVLTPHTAYYTQEALARRFMAYAENIKRLSIGKPLENLV